MASAERLPRGAARALVIGGYGSFGGRLARLLAGEPRLTLLIAGRSLDNAGSFAARYQSRAAMIPVRFDRDENVATQIAELAPDYVVDASGPFQAYGQEPYRVVEAAIECGASYLDLADASDFVCGIGQLDAMARKREVFALSGASTSPALSSAVCRHLVRDLSSVHSISGGIAPSPYSAVGRNIILAVAGSAGKAVHLQKNGATVTGYAFADSRRFQVAPPGHLPLGARTFSLADVADLRLLGHVAPGVGDVWFGAAPVPGLYHAALRLVARAVKTGLLSSATGLAPLMTFVMNHLAWGEHRGGMFMEIRGQDHDGRDTCRSWHLCAEGDDGPTIPVIACAAIIRNCLDGNPPAPGARPAIAELELADFEPYFAERKITTGIRSNTVDDAPVFRKVLDNAWARLPAEIRTLHDIRGTRRFEGRAQVTTGNSAIAKLIGRLVGFPAASDDVAVDVTMTASAGEERWSRNFDGHQFSSMISAGKGPYSHLVRERFGPASFAMALVIEDEQLHYVPRAWSFLGIPMPRFLLPGGHTYEYVEDGRFHFHVEITLPLAGHIVTYKGWLIADNPVDSLS